jgi:hypothetical protein
MGTGSLWHWRSRARNVGMAALGAPFAAAPGVKVAAVLLLVVFTRLLGQGEY